MGKLHRKKVIFPPVSQLIYAHSRRYHIKQVGVGGPSKSPTQILCAKIGSFNLKPQKFLRPTRSFKILHCHQNLKGSVRISATLMFANFIVKKIAFIREIGIEIFFRCTFYKIYIFVFLILGKKWKQIRKSVDSIGELRKIETNFRLDCCWIIFIILKKKIKTCVPKYNRVSVTNLILK